MKWYTLRQITLALAAFCALAGNAQAEVKLGDTPTFTATDSNGKTIQSADYKGKILVLEWTNHECPFVKKFYSVGKMQELQKTYTGKGVVWLSVRSSAEGKQGYLTGKETNELLSKQGSAPTAVILDPEGKLGKQFGAKTTPHMFIIDAKGKVAYTGAIDSVPSPDSNDIAGATNHVADTLDALLAGKPVTTTATQPYGCGVKYKD